MYEDFSVVNKQKTQDEIGSNRKVRFENYFYYTALVSRSNILNNY